MYLDGDAGHTSQEQVIWKDTAWVFMDTHVWKKWPVPRFDLKVALFQRFPSTPHWEKQSMARWIVRGLTAGAEYGYKKKNQSRSS